MREISQTIGWIRDNRERRTREWYDTDGRLCLWVVAEALRFQRNPDEPEFGYYPDIKPSRKYTEDPHSA